MGNITIYLAVSAELNTDALQARLQAGITQAKQKAADMEQRLKTPPAAPPVVAAAPVVTPAPTSCPACQGPIVANDVFCGNCGHRLH